MGISTIENAVEKCRLKDSCVRLPVIPLVVVFLAIDGTLAKDALALEP